MTDLTGNTSFEGPAGRIEAILKEPAIEPTRAAIVCHPHPLFGGTMHNKVVFRIARAFQDAGFLVLRFNFRGTGKSEGAHDDGIGEQDDLRAAIQFIETKYPNAELWLAGFSFGAAVMLQASCAEERARALVAAGTPFPKYDFSPLAPCNKPKLFVQGALDEFGSAEDLKRFAATLLGVNQVKVIEGADHFFEGHLPELFQAVSDFIALVEGEPSSGRDATDAEMTP
ncbi:MAG TPA: alpha/beta fold hydrolase [Blastocatellia bacterium]|nr:alpha/beta fold hydrolase [Blastocatellia bacterium]